MITHIHHINFIVRDLELGIKRYEALLGEGKFLVDSLQQRAVKTARMKLGDTWLVLVQPTDPDGVPGKFLAERGEGFFLISFGTDDLDAQLIALDEQGIQPSSDQRRGLENWLVADLPMDRFLGAQCQLCEEKNT